MLRRQIVTIAVALLASSACAAEVTYRKDIAPLWAQKCAACHGTNSPSAGEFGEDKKKFEAQQKGPRMDSYEGLISFVGWPDTGALMRRLDDGKSSADGKPGNMYQALGVTEAERQKNLQLFKAWVGLGAWNLNRWEAKGKVPAISKEQMSKLAIKY